MTILDIKLPRQLEVSDTDEAICRFLMERTARLWSGGNLEVPVIDMSDPLKVALRRQGVRGRIRYGFEAIMDRLENERKGIRHVRDHQEEPCGERVSRLLLVSHDGAERFYRHVEQLLQVHAPRVLGCILNIDGNTMGRLLTGKEKNIKAVMAEHKDAVSDILRAMAVGRGSDQDMG